MDFYKGSQTRSEETAFSQEGAGKRDRKGDKEASIRNAVAENEWNKSDIITQSWLGNREHVSRCEELLWLRGERETFLDPRLSC